MKILYINILLFALPLNILVFNQRNHKSTTPPHTPTNRSLCECEIYAPTNYDNDPQMKSVMQQFDNRTSQRLREYDERLQSKRKQCKERCDKESQKIILKDKLEKQMAQQLTTLDTNITTEDIPTCVCEKSLEHKTEKFCLNCGKTVGGFAPGYCLVSGLWYAAWRHYVPIAVAKAAMDAGMNVIKESLKLLGIQKIPAEIFKEISSTGQYGNMTKFTSIIQTELRTACTAPSSASICSIVNSGSPRSGLTEEEAVSRALKDIAGKAEFSANTQAGEVAANYASTNSSLTTGITASILAIEIIVLIMMIIYLILRYRRKKKMKKKLQYIKLLEE
ncbi:rifin PIR protein,putative [Plasmodium sp. DRC-Itaito]|nr:rifin PIR protein,putative [Plasmodium sp. DRC-Itaito]